MKQLFFIALAASLSISSFAQNFVIKGNVSGLTDNSLVYLSNPANEKDTLAKAKVTKGSFVLKGKLEDIDSRFLIFPSINKKTVLFIGNDNVTVTGKAEDVYNLEVSGSSSHKDYEDFLLYVKPLNDYVEYYRSMMQTAPSASTRDSMGIMMNTAYNLYQGSLERFISRKNNSAVAGLALAYSYDTDPNKDAQLVERRLGMLTASAQKQKYAQQLQQMLQDGKIGAIGSKAIDFTQNDQNGKPVSLSQFKGKYVLVDFWASWCRPCRLENPNVVAAYNQFKDKNFTVLGVSLDQNKENWLQAITADNLTWTHVSDLRYWSNAVAQLYRIQSIPQNLLIDPNGVIIGKNLRGEELLSKLKELIK